MVSKVQMTEGKIDELDFIGIENVFVSKVTIKKVKEIIHERGENSHKSLYLVRDLYSEHKKNSYNSTI